MIGVIIQWNVVFHLAGLVDFEECVEKRAVNIFVTEMGATPHVNF